MEMNRNHLKDLKTCFDETNNLKNLLALLLKKTDELAEKASEQKSDIDENRGLLQKQDGVMNQIQRSMEHMEEDLQGWEHIVYTTTTTTTIIIPKQPKVTAERSTLWRKP